MRDPILFLLHCRIPKIAFDLFFGQIPHLTTRLRPADTEETRLGTEIEGRNLQIQKHASLGVVLEKVPESCQN